MKKIDLPLRYNDGDRIEEACGAWIKLDTISNELTRLYRLNDEHRVITTAYQGAVRNHLEEFTEWGSFLSTAIPKARKEIDRLREEVKQLNIANHDIGLERDELRIDVENARADTKKAKGERGEVVDLLRDWEGEGSSCPPEVLRFLARIDDKEVDSDVETN